MIDFKKRYFPEQLSFISLSLLILCILPRENRAGESGRGDERAGEQWALSLRRSCTVKEAFCWSSRARTKTSPDRLHCCLHGSRQCSPWLRGPRLSTIHRLSHASSSKPTVCRKQRCVRRARLERGISCSVFFEMLLGRSVVLKTKGT